MGLVAFVGFRGDLTVFSMPNAGLADAQSWSVREGQSLPADPRGMMLSEA